MQMVPGRAFLLGQSATDAGASVSKQWLLVDGRQFLVEAVPVDAIADGLAKLPLTAMGSGSHKTSHTAAKHLVLPPQRQVKNTPTTMMMARAELPTKGFVLDYQTLNSSLTNYTFQGDTTYYISGTVTLFQTNTFEGGAVLKYATNASIVVSSGGVNWNAGSYRPVVFTSKDDNSVGERISGSTANPNNYFANPALAFSSLSMSPDIANLRISYARQAISLQGAGYGINFYDGQICNCLNGITCNGGDAFSFENFLLAGVKTNFNSLSSSSFNVQNSTFDSSSNLALIVNSTGQYVYLYFTNCIFANILNLTNGYAYPGSGIFQVAAGNNGFFNSPTIGSTIMTNTSNPFLPVGGGKYYLTSNCSFLDAGTTNIDSTTLADISSKTVYPPIVYSNITFSASTNFSPQIQRDTNAPDLGYHYDPVDYAFSAVNVPSYVNVTFAAGTAVAWFSRYVSATPGWMVGTASGLSLNNNASVTFNGTATSPCNFVNYHVVQEGGNAVWMGGYLGGIANRGSTFDPSNPAGLTASFTHFSHLSADSNQYRDGESGQVLKIQLHHCDMLGSVGGYNFMATYTNCLFDRVAYWEGTSDVHEYEIFRNCTFHGGSMEFDHWESGAPYWYSSVKNCAFDGTTFVIGDPFGVNTNYADYNYNAYLQGAAQMSPQGTNNIVVTNAYNWQTSWLGNYYLPANSPLIDAGSPTADLIGLYHFTTQTSQMKETNSVVDIGYHYVAVDANGNPVDTDGDGIPDYLEDANGNGIYDAGDLGNWLVGSFNGLSTSNGLSVFTPLK